MLGLLALGAGGAWAYVRSQYYVGIDGEQVAVYRGVTGSVAGLDLSTVAMRTDLGTQRLDRLARTRVENGIVAKDRADAERIVAQLEDDYPECTPTDEVPAVLPSAAPSPAANAAPVASPAPSAASSPAPLPAVCPGG